LYFNHSNNRAIRSGDWKLVALGDKGPWELYNLSQDRGEQHNLAAREPERVQKLAKLWNEHDKEYVTTREAAPSSTKPLLNRPSW
jgi:arylsulfatase